MAELYRRLEKRAPVQMPYWTMFKVSNTSSKIINANLNQTNGCLLALSPPSTIQVGSCNESSSGQWTLTTSAIVPTPPPPPAGPPIGAIVGGVVGGIAAIAAIGGAVVYYRKKKDVKPKSEIKEVDADVKGKSDSEATLNSESFDPPPSYKDGKAAAAISAEPSIVVSSDRTAAGSDHSNSIDVWTSSGSVGNSTASGGSPELHVESAPTQPASSIGDISETEPASTFLPIIKAAAGTPSIVSARPGTIEPGFSSTIPPANNPTSSVFYRVYELYGGAAANKEPVPVNEISRAAKAYTALNNDEISLEVGDSIDVEVAYDDGWALGTNLRTNSRGFFPADFLEFGAAEHVVFTTAQSLSMHPDTSEPSGTKAISSAGKLSPPRSPDEEQAFRASQIAPSRSTSSGQLLLAASSPALLSPVSTTSPATGSTPRSGISNGLVQKNNKIVDESEVNIDYSKVVGRGGFGVVYEGRLGRLRGYKVAVKTLKGDFADQNMRAIFEREVNNWMGLNQTNVLPLLAVCLSPPMMIMDLMKEGNMRQYLTKHKWDQEKAYQLLLGVTNGMTYLHEIAGIVHGDLKSLNVLVQTGGQAKITDFGMSKLYLQFTKTKSGTAGAIGGTAAFAAPEVWANRPAAPPADVYAFAMICYEVVSRGKYPFEEMQNPMAVSWERGFIRFLIL